MISGYWFWFSHKNQFTINNNRIFCGGISDFGGSRLFYRSPHNKCWIMIFDMSWHRYIQAIKRRIYGTKRWLLAAAKTPTDPYKQPAPTAAVSGFFLLFLSNFTMHSGIYQFIPIKSKVFYYEPNGCCQVYDVMMMVSLDDLDEGCCCCCIGWPR